MALIRLPTPYVLMMGLVNRNTVFKGTTHHIVNFIGDRLLSDVYFISTISISFSCCGKLNHTVTMCMLSCRNTTWLFQDMCVITALMVSKLKKSKWEAAVLKKYLISTVREMHNMTVWHLLDFFILYWTIAGSTSTRLQFNHCTYLHSRTLAAWSNKPAYLSDWTLSPLILCFHRFLTGKRSHVSPLTHWVAAT